MLLIYDPLTNSSTGVPTSYHATGPFKWLCAIAFQGILYALPCHADCILIFDPFTSRVSHVDTTAVAVGPGKWIAAVACGGKIYGIPDHAGSVLVFDPQSQEVSGIDVSHLSDATGKWQSAAVLGGKIYAVPYNAPLGSLGRSRSEPQERGMTSWWWIPSRPQPALWTCAAWARLRASGASVAW